MGLGSVNDLGLADARAKAYCNHTLLLQGIDSIEHRRIEKSKRRLEAIRCTTILPRADLG
jgi:hypothetical protein